MLLLLLLGVGGGQTTAEYMIGLEERVRAGNALAARAGTQPPPVYLEDEVEVIERAHRDQTEEEDDTDRMISQMVEGGDVIRFRRSSGDGVVVGGGERSDDIGADAVEPFSGRKTPFPNVASDRGKRNRLEMMRVAKRAGWGVSIKKGKRISWLKRHLGGWYGTTGMFREFKKVDGARLSKFITELLSLSNSIHPIVDHSRDTTGALDEDIPSWVSLCREYKQWEDAAPSTNAQQQANRIVNAVVQQRLMEPRGPLGDNNDVPLRSQVGAENNRDSGNGSGRTNASSVIRDNTLITGIVQDAGVIDGAVGPVATAVTSVIGGCNRTSRRTRGDVLSHIERSRDRQASQLCSSLGDILNNIVHPPRTLSDIAKDYREAERSLQDATSEGSRLFWQSLCGKLENELRSFGAQSGRSAD